MMAMNSILEFLRTDTFLIIILLISVLSIIKSSEINKNKEWIFWVYEKIRKW